MAVVLLLFDQAFELGQTEVEALLPDLRFLRKRAASNRKFSSLEMDVIPLVDQEGDRA